MDFQSIVKNIDRKQATLLSTAIFSILASWYIKRAIKKSKEFKTNGLKEIPSPEGEYFYLGHLPLFGKQPTLKISEWHKQLGPIFRTRVGVQNWIFIGDPEIAHDIFVSKGALSSGRPFLTYGNGIHGEGERGIAFTDYGKSWKNARKAALDILSPNSVDSFQHILLREATFGIDLMINDSQNKGIHPLAYTRLTAINVMFALVFGMNGCRSVEEPLYEKMVHCMEKNSEFLSITADLSAYFPILSFLDIIFKKERNMKHFVEKECRPFYKELIEVARKADQPSLIKNLDKIKTSLDIDEQNIIALTTELMIAGVDTVSVSLEWAMAVLCHYPEWQKRMSDEVDLFIEKNGRLPFFSDRNDFPNLTAVIKEILRYRPSVHLGVPHKANEDIVYRDYVIPKGTLLMSNNHTTNNDPKYFEEPEKFKPERYLKDSRSVYASSNGSIHSRELFTFGWGRRICPGIYLSEGEMFGWLTQLLSKCTIEPIISGGEAIYPEIQDCRAVDATISPLPYKVRLEKRQSSVL